MITSDQPPPVFVPEGGTASDQPNDDESIIPLIAPDEGAPPNIPFVESDDTPVACDAASVADSYSSDEPVKASKFGNANLAVSVELTNLPVPLDPSRFQFAPPNSPVRNLRANNAIVFGMRLVILC